MKLEQQVKMLTLKPVSAAPRSDWHYFWFSHQVFGFVFWLLFFFFFFIKALLQTLAFA